jgi:hypothetical protein
LSPGKFVEVLDVSGFVEDAYEVAARDLADEFSSERLASFLGRSDTELSDIPASDLRLAVTTLAAGEPLESLKWKIGAELFAILQADLGKFRGPGQEALRREFDSVETEFETSGSAVFGSSIVNFPRRRRRTKTYPKYEPVSSLDLG